MGEEQLAAGGGSGSGTPQPIDDDASMHTIVASALVNQQQPPQLPSVYDARPHTSYSDTGLFGIYLASEAIGNLDDLMYYVLQQWNRLTTSVTDAEIERSKQQLKAVAWRPNPCQTWQMHLYLYSSRSFLAICYRSPF